MKLEQENRGEKKVFLIQKTSLKITEQSSLGYRSRNIPFENITNEFVSLKFNPIHYLIIFVLFVLLVFSFLVLKLYAIESLEKIYGTLIVFLIGGAFGIFNYKIASTVLKCIDYEGIEFYKDYPSKKEMEEFINELFQRRNKYLKSKFNSVNPNLNYEYQYIMFHHLHTLEVIDFKKLTELTNELNQVFTNRFIPFSEN
ncbi:conserved protein of unknown function [Tenacibaculum sp. 190130A14a]|uniref:Uncharacterized protein n=1 Tax=Tenacibaculum polynesiense TaxID=3137857 RepID=A0ABP1EX68_9FLAO